MKVNELELYKALKVLTESGYLISNSVLKENRTFDVEELATKYKERIMKLLRQKLVQMLDRVYDGEEVDKTITIEIPSLMVPVTYRKEPVKMKALTVKLYSDKKDIRSDYDAQKGKGKGNLYANAMGDTNPDTDPVILMINLPNVVTKETTTTTTTTKAKNTKTNTKTNTKANDKKITEGKYTSRKSNLIPFPDVRAKEHENKDIDKVDDIINRLEQRDKKQPAKSKTVDKKADKKTTGTTGRTAARDALYARFRDKYWYDDDNDYWGWGSSYGNYGGYGSYGGYGGYYGGYASYYDDSFKFKDVVEEIEKTANTPQEVIDKIMEEYFDDYFQEVLHHELTHYIQANNMSLDGTEDAHDYDAHAVMASGAYNSDELEYEAKLHQNLPDYIDDIQKAKNITSIAKTLVTKLFSNKFNTLSDDKQHRYFNEILTLCQVIKSHPEITKHNFNTPRIKKLLRDSL